MRREDWAQSNDLASMLGFLRGKSSDRKLRLFGLACCRHAGRFAEDESRAVLAVVEHYADGLVGPEALWQAFMLLPDVPGRRLAIPRVFDTHEAREVARWALGLSGTAPATQMLDETEMLDVPPPL